MCITIKLPMPPSVNAAYANNRNGGRHRTKRYQVWANAAGWAIKAQRPKSIAGWYVMHIRFAMRFNLDGTAKRIDLGNHEKVASDLLETMGIIEDDMLCSHLELSWDDELDDGCIVTLSPAPKQWPYRLKKGT